MIHRREVIGRLAGVDRPINSVTRPSMNERFEQKPFYRIDRRVCLPWKREAESGLLKFSTMAVLLRNKQLDVMTCVYASEKFPSILVVS